MNFPASSGGQTAPPNTTGLPRPNQAPPSSPMSNAARNQTYGRQGEELLGPPAYGQQVASSYTPQDDSRGANPVGGPLPGTLQAGRPAPTSANTAPSTVPILPPISTQSQQYAPSSRASTASHTHSYSRSSPAAGYTDDGTKYASPASHKYISVQTPQTGTYSPLGLADIRPRADSGLSDGPASANPFQEPQAEPTNCNYLAPWAVYSFDWCKWPVQQQGLGDAAGKMAIGSYLEDGHNYVGSDPMLRMEFI